MMSNFQSRNQRLRVHQVYTGKNLSMKKGVAISRNSLIFNSLCGASGWA